MDPSTITEVMARFETELAAAGTSTQAIDEVRRSYLGKSGVIKQMLRGLRDVEPERRKDVAQALNQASATIESALEPALERARAAEVEARIAAEWIDLGLPGVVTPRGARHPVNLVEQRCIRMLRRLGFEWRDGPEVETPFYNFDALNIPAHHPARDMQDTFWLPQNLLLRSHTTPVQARVLAERPPAPIKILSAGRVYRNEAVDATHLAMFHQLEGFWLDRGLTVAHLKGVLAFIARALYGESQRIRFKPKFYPYTEPSVGMDLACTSCDGAGCHACHHAGWVTVIGAGMIHRNVLLQFDYDPDEYSGIAFGIGTTRMASQWVGVERVRSLYEPDLRLLTRIHRRGR